MVQIGNCSMLFVIEMLIFYLSFLTDVQIQFSSKVAEMILQNVVGHRSITMLASKSQFGMAELNDNGLQKWKTVSTTCYARLHTL
jgi:hypothetical protein